ncbi:MAG: hypothetical protein CR982_09040 [Candidatus Cloacimonadota bacterium]|nr:MAG: hypothetical protein CR982_09040 [Candidatus Cloacimonadota bacterium]PIE78611.1 MAG: hypothetical protein CSA15_06935 [Candidatus Delongbacteria bacterium]
MIELTVDLKKYREEQKRDLQEISDSIKINIKYLEAIEKEDYGIIPDAYKRMFISSYAKELGLDPEELFADKVKERSYQESRDNQRSGNSEKDNETFHTIFDYIEKYKSQILIAFVVLVVFISFFVVKNFWENIKGAPEKINVVTAAGINNSNFDNSIIVNEDSNKKDFLDIIKVSVLVEDSCYVIYFSDSSRVNEKLLLAGDSLVLEAENRVEMKAGKVESLKLFVEGEEKRGYKEGKKGTAFIQVIKGESPKLIRRSEKIVNYLKVRSGKE